MATTQTIAVTLTADANRLKAGFGDAEKSAERLGTKVWALDRQFKTNTASMERSSRGIGGGLANGALELSRGLEDASIGYQLNGIQGAVRGASNNFSQLAFMMGGPVLGAVVGLTAAALPMLINYLTGTEDKAKDAEERLKNLRTELDRVAEQAGRRVQFQGLLSDLESSKELEEKIKERERQLAALNAQSDALDKQRMTPFRAGSQKAFDDITRREKEVREAQNKTLEERIRLENEINVLISKRNDLQAQDEFGKRFDAAEEKQRKRESDLGSLESMLSGRLSQLGGQQDPLFGMDIPRNLMGEVGSLFNDLQNFDRRRPAATATAVEADSQGLLRLQAQAKEAAEAKKQRDKLIQRIEQLLQEVRIANRALQADGDDVNLN